MNYIEWMPLIVVYTLVSGWLFPQVVMYTSWLILLGRVIFAIGYSKAPHLRGPGFGIQFLCIFINLVLSLATCYYLMTGK